MSVRYILRRGLLEDVTKENLKEGELCYTTDTHQIFIGTDTNPKDIVAAAVEGTISPYINEAMGYASTASVNATAAADSAAIATTKATDAANIVASIDIDSLEPALGNPASDGMVLSSTTAGVRSWITGGIQDLPSLGITSTASELNYVSGVTSSIQAQLNTKAPIESPTFTGIVTGTFNGNLTGNVSGSSGSCSGNALTATKATGIIGIDTRYNNYAPSSYIGDGAGMYLDRSYSRSEFKSVSSMGLGDYLSGTYCYVITHVPWSDISGGKPVQFAYGDGVPCYRIATDASTWGAWTPINKGGDADTLDGNHAAYFSPVSHTHTVSTITDFPASMPASDVSAWAKATSKPTYTASEIGLGNVTNESKATMFTSPTLTGTTTANVVETTQSLGIISSATTIDCANGAIVSATIGAALAFTFTASASSSTCRTLTLLLTNGGAYTITWPSSVKWANGTAPTLSASGIDILHFITVDDGTSWLGCLGGKGFA